jgi:hypothetical protein
MTVLPINDTASFIDVDGKPQGAQFVMAQPPFALLTDNDGAGPNARFRVDVGQTGFFAGREFRTFMRLTGSVVIRAVVPVNVILFGLSCQLSAGEMDIETVVGGTPGGSFSTVLPIFPRNTMSERPTPFYTPAVVLDAGGTHTGGTILDVLHIKVADNSNFASSVGAEGGDERGVGAGTYYFRLVATGTTSGVFKTRWEERP